MADTWIDATQSYENETISSTEITNVSNDDLLAIPSISDANYLIKLVNNPATNTNNLYILQANTNGEIRFLTKDAYLNNDVSANDGHLYYNAKIGADGKLYLYWTYNAITNPVYFSGWKDIMADVAQGFRDVNLLEASVFVLEGQIASLTANVATIDGIVAGHTTLLSTHTAQISVLDLALADLTTIVVNMASMKSFTHQGWSGWKRRGNVKDAWSRMSDRYNFTPSSTSATGITTAGELFSLGGNTGAEVATIAGLTSRVASEGGSAINIALSASKKFFDGLNYAFIGAGIVGAITAVAYTYDKQGAQSDEIALPFLYDVRAGLYNDSLKASNDPTKKTLLPYLIHKNGLTIDATTNNGFTTAGIYEYAGNASYPEMSINIRISAGFVAEIVAVANSGTKVWAVGNTIIIPKASIGGTSGNLTINVITIYTATQVVDLQIAETQTRIENRDKKMKRRSNVVNYDDIDTAVFTNTTATQAYTEYWDTQETLTYKILKSRLNLLPTGASDVDIYTSTGQIGIGTTPATKLHVYHATDNKLRLETGTTGTNSIEFRRGTANDVFTDYRLISDTGVFKLQFENNLLAYGASGTELFNTTSTLTSIFKNTSFSGNVGINVAPHATYKLDVAGDINISTGSLLRVNGTAYKPAEAVLADTATALASGTILGISQGGTGASTHVLGNVILGNGSGALTSATGLLYTSGTTTLTAPNVNVPTGGKYKINSVNLTLADLDGTLAVNKGGTGQTTFTANGLLIGNTTSGIAQNAGLTFITSTLTAPNVNVPTGGKYKINNVDLSYNDLTDKLTAGTNITISATNVISSTGGGTAYTGGNGITITGTSIALSNSTTSSFTISQLLASGSIDMFILQNNATNSLRVRQNFLGTNDFTYNVIQKNNNIDYPAFTFKNGQVAVGTTNVPTYPLDVAGDINFSGDLRRLSALYKPAGAVLADTATDLATGAILSVAKGGTGANTFTAGRLLVGNTTSALQTYTGLTWTSGTNLLTTTNLSVGTNSTLTGNVGIGTAPSGVATTKLDVLGDVNIVGKTTQKGTLECLTLNPATPTIPAALSIIPAPTFTFTPSSTITRCAILTYQGVGTSTTYSVVIPAGGMLCDILMVGGGGYGGRDIGAGGGGGAVLYATDVLLKQDTYMVSVGRGAIFGSGEQKGQSTTGFGAILLGGGSAGDAVWNGAVYGYDGGSGSGGKSVPDSWSQRGGRPIVGGSIKGGILCDGTLYEGKVGGYGVQQVNQVVSAGGGGANAVGGNGQTSGSGGGSAVGSSGGAGISNNILDATYFWGGGGGGGSYNYTTPANGGAGGGGAGQNQGATATAIGNNGANSFFAVGTAINGINGTGGGGGGVGYTNATAGSGGAGVIIIRYKRPINHNETIDILPTGTNATTNFKQGVIGANYKIEASVSSIIVDAFAIDPITASTSIKNSGLVVKSSTNDTLITNNCGIGIDPSSTYKLNVNGDLNVNGTIWQNGFTVNAGFQQYRTFNFTYSGDTNFLLTTRARYCNIICWTNANNGWIASNGANMAVNEFRGTLGFTSGISNTANNWFFYWTMQGDTPRPFKAWFGNGSNTTFTFLEMWYN
jgi:hypothetical protein